LISVILHGPWGLRPLRAMRTKTRAHAGDGMQVSI
jgi:hypothetical protein